MVIFFLLPVVIMLFYYLIWLKFVTFTFSFVIITVLSLNLIADDFLSLLTRNFTMASTFINSSLTCLFTKHCQRYFKRLCTWHLVFSYGKNCLYIFGLYFVPQSYRQFYPVIPFNSIVKEPKNIYSYPLWIDSVFYIWRYKELFLQPSLAIILDRMWLRGYCSWKTAWSFILWCVCV